jgi:uncharacterized membrane protein YhaH (DUF805 family)
MPCKNSVFLPFPLNMRIYSVASFSVIIRRLHNMDISGYYYPMQFVPAIGMVIFTIIIFTGGTEGPNCYGPNPPED